MTDILETLLNPLGFEATEPGATPDQQEAFAKMSRDRNELCLAFRYAFRTDHGKKVLAHLRQMTIENSTWCASLGMEKGVSHGFAREGQNALVRYIEDMIKQAEALAKQKKQSEEKDNA
jgi:hypothetical protein